jgi:hypothetical protein
MSLHVRYLLRSLALVVGVMLVFATSQSLAVGIDDYRLQRTFTLPAAGPGSGGNVLMDTLPDGRILVLNGRAVSVETAPQSSVFAPLGNVAGFAPGFGPSFLAVSPDGSRAVAGTNGEGSVVVFDTNNPAATTPFTISDLAGEWIDNQLLAITSFGSLQVLNTATSAVETIINIGGGFSGGVTVDADGNLYTGNGFDSATGGSETGWIKAFSQADWQNALATDTPLDFETDGIPVADLLTAASLGFDASGNMFVGGGDFFGGSGDLGYAALVDASAVAAAFAGSQTAPPISSISPAGDLRKLMSPPDTVTAQLPPFWNLNRATDELYLGYTFGDGTIYVYAVPEPAAWLLMSCCGLMFVARWQR